MSAVKPNAVLLIVESTGRLSPREKAIEAHLQRILGKPPRNIGKHAELPGPETVELVVVCATDAPKSLLTLAVPVIVCHPEALYDLGMTLGNRSTDFGTTEYDRILICPDQIDHQLAAGYSYVTPVTDQPCTQGWGKPGRAAAVVATVADDRSMAVIFAQEKGSDMPACRAAARRCAFLPMGNKDGELGKEGKRLFEAALAWTRAEAPTTEEQNAGSWFSKDGSPTRVLSAQEYRDWVHEQVEGRIWGRVKRGLTFWGASGLIAIASFLFWAIQSMTSSQVKEQASKIKEVAKEQADTSAKQEAAAVVANLVVHQKETAAAINKALTEQVAEMIDKDARFTDLITKEAVKGITKDARIAEELFKRLEQEPDDEMRRLILKVGMAFASADLRATKFRDMLLELIENASQKDRVRSAALEAYQPKGGLIEDNNDLLRVLKTLNERESLSPEMQAAYSKFVSSFSDERAASVIDWLLRKTDLPDSCAIPVLKGLGRMSVAVKGRSSVVPRFVELALSKSDVHARNMGIKGLELIDRKTKEEIDDAPRHAALTSLLDLMDEDPRFYAALTSSPVSFDLETRLQRLERAFGQSGFAGQTDRFGLTSYRSAALASLVKSSDHHFVKGRIKAVPLSEQRSSQALLVTWVDTLTAKEGIEAGLFDKFLGINGVFQGEATLHFAQRAMKHGDPSYAERFLIAFSDYQRAYNVSASPRLKAALRDALSHDERNSVQFKGLVSALANLRTQKDESVGGNNKIVLRLQLLDALNDLLRERLHRASSLNPPPLVVFREGSKLGENAQDDVENRQREVLKLLKETYAKALNSVVAEARVQKNYELIESAHTEWLQSFPKDQQQLYERAKNRFENLQQNDKAEEDLRDAQRVDPNNYQYEELLGDIYVRRGLPDSAFAQYSQATSKLDFKVTPAKDPTPLYRKMIIAGVAAKRPAEAVIAEANYKLGKEAAASPLRIELAAMNGLIALAKKDDEAARKIAEASPPFSPRTLYHATKYLAHRQLKEHDKAAAELKNWDRKPRANDLQLIKSIAPELTQQFGVMKLEDHQLVRDPEKPGQMVQRTHTVQFGAGEQYFIDMESTAVDSFLILNDANGVKVAWDDDSGGFPNARIIYTAPADGTYTIVATSFSRQAEGPYTLIVRKLPKKED